MFKGENTQERGELGFSKKKNQYNKFKHNVDNK